MNKEYILAHVDELSAEQLTEFIVNDIVTLDELRETEMLDASKRRAINLLITTKEEEKREKQEEQERIERESWLTVQDSDEYSIREWIDENSNNRYVEEARQTLRAIEEKRERTNSKKQIILDKIKNNPSGAYPNTTIEGYMQDGVLDRYDLIDYCDIPESVIDNLDKVKTPILNIGETPDSIPEGATDVYFWGITGSGKTTALGAILQMADKKGVLNIKAGSGNRYATQLKNIFSDDGEANDFLPPGSPVEVTQYMPISLKRPNEKKDRAVSFIELSGEIFKCFAEFNATSSITEDNHRKTFNSLNDFLDSNNRKIHFFFIDYNTGEKIDDSGLTQKDYLAAAATYFQDQNIFDRSTDAIYVVLTKSDLIHDEEGNSVDYDERVRLAKEYLQENYPSFINTLKSYCKQYSINGGKLTVEPFSLGKVYFENICNFDGTAAGRIVDILIDRIAGTKKSFWDIFNK